MITETTLIDCSIAAQVHAVAQAAYALEAERIGCADFPPLRETLGELRDSPERFLMFQRSGKVVAALSFDQGADAVVITRLVVSPAHLRQGIATALLADLERRLPPFTHLTVSTARDNTAAVLLYRKLRYQAAGASTSAEGIPLVHFVKSSSRVA